MWWAEAGKYQVLPLDDRAPSRRSGAVADRLIRAAAPFDEPPLERDSCGMWPSSDLGGSLAAGTRAWVVQCHIEGTMRPGTVIDLAGEAGIGLPVDDPTDVYAYANPTEFLRVFWLVQSALATPPAWARLAFESLIDGAEHGRRSRAQPAGTIAVVRGHPRT